MRNINEIIIHCSATRPGWLIKLKGVDQVAEIRNWHVEDNGWDDIGYHYIIDRKGKVHKGRPLDVVGAHCRGHNARSIGVCLIGGFGGCEDDKFSDHFTEAQDDALAALLAKLTLAGTARYEISGHNEYAAKACPCFDVQEWLTGAYSARVAAVKRRVRKLVKALRP